MTRPWDQEEVEWARECATAGDSFEEIADWSERAVAEVATMVGLPAMTSRQREVASLLAAGLTPGRIDQVTGVDGARHVITAIKAKGYDLPDAKSRLGMAEIRALQRQLGCETLTELAGRLGVPMGSATHWRQRGLPLFTVREGLHG